MWMTMKNSPSPALVTAFTPGKGGKYMDLNYHAHLIRRFAPPSPQGEGLIG